MTAPTVPTSPPTSTDAPPREAPHTAPDREAGGDGAIRPSPAAVAPVATGASTFGLERWAAVDWRQVARRGLLVIAATIAVFIVWLLTVSGLAYNSSQDTLRRGFSDELRDGLAPVNQPIDAGAPVAFLEIPALGMEQVVVEGTTADITMTGPGHLRTSAIPGQPGVSVVLGRRATFGGVFGSLPELQRGDTITVTTGQGELDYTVASVATYGADDASAFVADEQDALLLVTSEPGVFVSGRLVVTAVPEGDSFERGTRVPQAAPTPAELGLGGNWAAAVGLLVWLEIAAVVVVAALFLMRRWYRWPAWVIVTPVLVVVGWLVFQQFAQLLPATL